MALMPAARPSKAARPRDKSLLPGNPAKKPFACRERNICYIERCRMSNAGNPNFRGAIPPNEDFSDTGPDLAIRGFKGTPEEIERQWLEKVYKGRGDSQKQLTVRAVFIGGVLGMFMSISN